ncbi:PIN domain-containing protein [Pyrococcus kukulkanii]|uniref:PIN domain-containing protein n=1 Tax=Pyrococcus kukulkanii TaxID=1609559 RepID=UPI003566998E
MPDYFWEELKRLHAKLVKITRLSHEEVEFLLEKIGEQIITIDREVYEDFLEEAKRICPDPKDVPYVALAMATATPILAGDKKLTREIKDKVKILPLNEAVRMV